MTPDESIFFRILDAYSREQHGCFVAEMFPDNTRAEYIVCFRPVAAGKDSPNRYAYRYVKIPAEDIKAAARAGSLSSVVLEQLKTELTRLDDTGGRGAGSSG
jgi:hypothetical protein